MIKIKFEGEVIEAPNKWSEVKVSQFINKYFLSGNAIQLLSALSGIEASRLANTKEDLTVEFDKAVKFMREDPLGWKSGSTTELKILGVVCKVPRNLELETFGQKIMFGQVLASSKWHYDVLPKAIAIYLAPQIYPKDWYNKIDEVAEAVEDLPIKDVWNIADFFLTNTLQYRRGGEG